MHPTRTPVHSRRRRLAAAALATVLSVQLVAACSKSDGGDATKDTTTTVATSTTAATSTTKKDTTKDTKPLEIVPSKGSVLDVLAKLPGTTKFAKVVAKLPKQTFTQARGITLLVPQDSAITDAQLLTLLGNANKASVFVSQYLAVGGVTVKQMGKTIALADGTSRAVDAKAKTVGKVKLVSTDHKATNGYIDVLAGVFPAKK